jgi:hypothetical protein
MNTKLIDAGWNKEICAAIRADRSGLRIVSPFIKAGALSRLLALDPHELKVITRFNLNDFACGVSDISAMQMLLEAGAQVRGIRNLHAKLYLIGTSRAIVTSANLTQAALDRNHEFGLVSGDPAVISTCHKYFDRLWQFGKQDLTTAQLDDWDQIVSQHNATGGRSNNSSGLGDFGAIDDNSGQLILPPSDLAADASQAFVKFLGQSGNRAELSLKTIDEIKSAGCHWAVAYPAKRRPRGVEDGAIVYIARLTKEPNDMRIFGRAIGMKHEPGRDDASPDEIALRPWKNTWPRYIRVHHAEFVAGTMANGISLNELMEELEHNSFASTQRNARSGKGSTKTRMAYARQAGVELTSEAKVWLDSKLEGAFAAHGKIPQVALDSLDWPLSHVE